MGLARLFYRSIPSAVRWVDGLFSILGVILLFIDHVIMGVVLIASALFVAALAALYNRQRAQDNRERDWLKKHRKSPAYVEPSITTRKNVMQAAISLVAILVLAAGGVTIYEHFSPKPFVVAWSEGAWITNGGPMVAAGFFGYVQGRNAIIPVNALEYVRIINGANRTTIIGYDAEAHSSGSWIPLRTMADEDSLVQYYKTTPAAKMGLGWHLPRSMDLGVSTEQYIEPGGVAAGWIFFAYPPNLTGPIDKIKFTIRSSSGYSASNIVEPGAESSLDNIHGPEDPDTSKPPTDLTSNTVSTYEALLPKT
jgi:hypothetical protein